MIIKCTDEHHPANTGQSPSSALSPSPSSVAGLLGVLGGPSKCTLTLLQRLTTLRLLIGHWIHPLTNGCFNHSLHPRTNLSFQRLELA